MCFTLTVTLFTVVCPLFRSGRSRNTVVNTLSDATIVVFLVGFLNLLFVSVCFTLTVTLFNSALCERLIVVAVSCYSLCSVDISLHMSRSASCVSTKTRPGKAATLSEHWALGFSEIYDLMKTHETATQEVRTFVASQEELKSRTSKASLASFVVRVLMQR